MKTKKTEKTTTPKIEWPADWNANEGWPSDLSAKSPDGRTWGELDAELRKQGTSLDAVIGKLRGTR